MTIHFERPIGAPSDTNELEYVSALLQTSTHYLRHDATLTARDIRRYLKSRHGLRVPMEQVTQELLVNLAGTTLPDNNNFRVSSTSSFSEEEEPPLVAKPKDDKEAKLDLVQFVSLLLIPVFRDLEEKSKKHQVQKELMLYGRTTTTTTQQDVENGETEYMEQSCRRDNTVNNDDEEEARRRNVVDDNDDEQHEEETNSLQVDDFIEAILLVMLHECGYEYGDELTESVLRKMLRAFQEEDWSDHVITDMIRACRNDDNDEEPVYLTRETLLRALTADVSLYNVKRQTMGSTHYEDALESGNGNGNHNNKLQRFWTAPNIDNAADTYASFAWRVLSWFTLAITFLAYLFDGIQPRTGFPAPNCMNSNTTFDTFSDFACKVAISIAVWLEIFVKLATMGFAFLFFTTLGNSVYHFSSSRWKGLILLFLGMATVVFYCVLSFRFNVKTDFFDTTIESTNYFQASLALTLGSLLFVTQFIQLFRLLVPHSYFDQVRWCLTPGALRMERNVKLACQFKVQKMIRNALICHSEDGGGMLNNKQQQQKKQQAAAAQGGRQTALLLIAATNMQKSMADLDKNASGMADAVVRYNKKRDNRESAGGILWTWRRMRDLTLFREEGCWIFPRLVSSNLVQWVVVLGFMGAAFLGTRALGGLSINPEYASEEELQFAFLVGAAPAVAGATATALTYIPSAFCTVLKYRSGNLPSLKDRRWLQHRYAMDTTNLLFGASFWACAASGIVLWIVVGLLGYSWAATNKQVRKIANTAYAVIGGVGVTMLIKICIMQVIRLNWYGAFMRRRPAAINIVNAMEDSWNLGLTTWVILVRTVKILGCAIFYIGRIDTPFLAPGVGWLFDKFPMDTLPISFNKDLLIHDAHRHPYIERVGLMYMLKIRHGNDFGRPEGAAWRLLFTQALFPWLRKYRWNRSSVNRRATSDSIQLLRKENRKLCLRIKELEEIIEQISNEHNYGGLQDLERQLLSNSPLNEEVVFLDARQAEQGNTETTEDDEQQLASWTGVATGLPSFEDHSSSFEVKMST